LAMFIEAVSSACCATLKPDKAASKAIVIIIYLPGFNLPLCGQAHSSTEDKSKRRARRRSL
jgi:hypothetical protein